MQEIEKGILLETYKELSRKWAIPILKDMFLGCERFTDFLTVPCPNHEQLSNKVLAIVLKRLEKLGFISKKIESTTPVRIKYSLTPTSLSLNKLLYAKIIWQIELGLISRDDPYFRGNNIEEAFGIN